MFQWPKVWTARRKPRSPKKTRSKPVPEPMGRTVSARLSHLPVNSVERFFQFSLLGLVASGFFALAGSHFLDSPTLILTFTALALRGLFVAGWLRLAISPKIISLLGIAYVAFYPIDFYFISRDFFTATIHGVCFLAAIKILTADSNRDYLYTGVVAFIELIGAALLSFQAGFFAWLALYILFAIAAFTSSEIRRGLASSKQTIYAPAARVGWRLAIVACAATCGILVLTGGLFLIVPRTARAAAMLFPNAPHLTGFSNVVDLGTFGEISKDTRPVMHVLSYSRPLPPNLKWRGAALSRFDGKRWSESGLPGIPVSAPQGAAQVAGDLQRSRRGRRLLYRVDVGSSDTGTLFIAGVPEFININAPRLVRTPEDGFRVFPVTGEGLRYEVSAHAGPPLAQTLPSRDRTRYLDLPPIDTRIYVLAREWAGKGSPLDHAFRIQSHLRRDFTYTLESSNKPVRDPLSNFLFVTKRGYCEYFASAMAVMLRSLGIPSRVATGFQSGYYNKVSGMYVIRASDAHAWVEAWIDGLGWMTFDPTPAGTAGAQGSALLSRINMYFDAADSMWQQWVLAYDLGHQAALAAKVEYGLRSWNQKKLSSTTLWGPRSFETVGKFAAWVLFAALVAAFAVFAAPPLWRVWRRRRDVRRIARGGGSASDASLLYRHMLEALAKRGFEKPAWFTPIEFARHLPAEEGERMTSFTALYNSARFGGSGAATEQLAELLKHDQRGI